MDEGKTLEELGLMDYIAIQLHPNKENYSMLLYKDILHEYNGQILGFEFAYVEFYSSDIKESVIRYEVVFEGRAQFDSVRHLWVNKREKNFQGYLYYPNLPRLSRAIITLHGLQEKKCLYPSQMDD